MDLEPLSIIIGAALGSAGLSGVLAGLVQLGRAARTARSIEQIRKALEGDDTGSGGQALRVALNRERLRLASLSIIGTPRVYVQLVALLVISAAMVFGLFSTGLVPLVVPGGTDRDGDGIAGEVGASTEISILLGVILLLYIVVTVFFIDLLVQSRRARFIDAISRPGADAGKISTESARHGRVPPGGN